MKTLVIILAFSSLGLAQENLIDSWVLNSWTAKKDTGSVVYPYGKDAQGSLSYSDDGRVSLFLLKPNRSIREISLVIGFFSYEGSYEIKDDKVIHTVEVCSDSLWVGEKQTRYYRFSGDTLILTSPPIETRVSDNKPASHTLKWLRRKSR